MEKITKKDELGRESVYLKDEITGLTVLVGPDPLIVEGLPEPFATRLHNVLVARGLLTYHDISTRPAELTGALQEALQVDAQILAARFYTTQGK